MKIATLVLCIALMGCASAESTRYSGRVVNFYNKANEANAREQAVRACSNAGRRPELLSWNEDRGHGERSGAQPREVDRRREQGQAMRAHGGPADDVRGRGNEPEGDGNRFERARQDEGMTPGSLRGRRTDRRHRG